MKNLMLALLVGSLVSLTTGAYAADADVGKIKNSELSIGVFDICDVAYEYSAPAVFDIDFEVVDVTTINSPVNEFGILTDLYIGTNSRKKFADVNYWILYKHLLNKPDLEKAIVAPRDKLSC